MIILKWCAYERSSRDRFSDGIRKCDSNSEVGGGTPTVHYFRSHDAISKQDPAGNLRPFARRQHWGAYHCRHRFIAWEIVLRRSATGVGFRRNGTSGNASGGVGRALCRMNRPMRSGRNS